MHRAQRLLSVRLRSGEEGYFLVMALILTAAVMVMAGGLAMLSTAALRAAQRNLDRARALYAAESGMNRAIYAIVKGEVKSSNVATWEMRDQAISPSTTYSVWFRPEDTPCPARTVVAEGSSNGVTRRFSARVRLTTVPFPRAEVPTAGCEDDYADVHLALKPIDEITPPNGWSRWSRRISGKGPVYIRVDGNLPLTDVSIETTGEVNVFVTGDLLVNRNASITVSPSARVNFYVYGNVVLGADALASTLVGSKLDVYTNDYVVFHVQKGLISNPGASVKVSPARGDKAGAVVFLMSNSGAYASTPVVFGPQEGLVDLAVREVVCTWWFWWLLPQDLWSWLCQEPSTELAVYAPSRTIKMTSTLWEVRLWGEPVWSGSTDPNLHGSIVYREVTRDCVSDVGNPGLNRLVQPKCTPTYSVRYDDRLAGFPFGRPSRLVPGSWREEHVTP